MTSLFVMRGGAVVPTEYARGPWDPGACHGGPVAALIVRAIEQMDDSHGFALARCTVELVRPVPIAPLLLTTKTVRPGRKVRLVEATLGRADDGTTVARARALRIRRLDEDLEIGPDSWQDTSLGSPNSGRHERARFGLGNTLAFHHDGVEHRFVEGSFDDDGPCVVWIRLVVPLFPGEQPSGAQRAAAAADFGNGVSSAMDAERFMFINPELTLHLFREPIGEWIALESRSLYSGNGVGLAESSLYDEQGRFGRSAQSLLLDHR